MSSFLYLYRPTERGIELYVNGMATLEGLLVWRPWDTIKITSAAATGYRHYGFATEREFPELKSVEALIHFLEEHDDIWLIDLAIEIVGRGTLTTHDDGECHFTLKHKKDAMAVLKKVTPQRETDRIVGTVVKYPGTYVSLDAKRRMRTFASFSDYLAADDGSGASFGKAQVPASQPKSPRMNTNNNRKKDNDEHPKRRI
ncbi:hypothetical protein [Maribacter sp. 2307ULW6-5]|uniref:hypothetical protein n=1 Tax=Maribacter sp. 2307ULW6-5 TaxID=3386275 RepID=UPI0039BD144B